MEGMKRSAKKRIISVETSSLSLVTQPSEFFRDEISKAIHKQKLRTDADTEFYLVDLLTRFMLTENFFTQDESGNQRQQTLALILAEAMNTPEIGKRNEELRKLGDVSLYTAGFFSDSLARKMVDVDYYISMGSNAYASLARMAIDAHFRKIFTALSDKFVKFVDVLAEVSASSVKMDEKNILRLYETWLKTGSERAEEKLKSAGIVTTTKKSKLQ